MGFYDTIAKYYDAIFPVGSKQIEFIKHTAGEAPKDILDVACGTGGYSVALAKEGYSLTAIDLDLKMVEAAIEKANNAQCDVKIYQSDMLTLDQQVTNQYDVIFCIGNSVAHLNTKDDIKQFFHLLNKTIKSNGEIILQIINYDRVLSKGINSLPTVQNDDIGLTFERMYELDEANHKILFKTKLIVQDKRIENTIPLLPITSNEFITLLSESGFKHIETYGDFNLTPYDTNDSYHLVIKATK